MYSKEKIKSDLPILPIGAISQTLNIHQRTLRIYDKEGILCPKRTSKNRRNYSLDDLEKAKLIMFLTRNLALNLAGVKIILSMLEMSKVEPKDYVDYVAKVAKAAKVDTKAQEENIKKTSKRGRKTISD